jgi:alpha-glucosidase
VKVAAQRQDPASILTLYRRLLALGHDRPALSVGADAPVQGGGDVLAYRRPATTGAGWWP